MMTSRRAARSLTPTLIRIAVGALAAVGAAFFAMSALIIVIARRVVTPVSRAVDTRIIDLDTRAQTITLDRTEDTVLPGRYGLFTHGTLPYLKLGSVLAETPGSVTRKLLTQVGEDAHLTPDATFSGWYFDRPDQLQLDFRPELIGTSLGPCPAWIFPGDDTWVVQIHGRGAQRAETLRAVPVMHRHGYTSMVVSYRNDGEAPRSRSGTYGLGTTEWRDVDAALGYAKRHGAKRIILMGWSMGGAIAMQTMLRSSYRHMVAGVILESPVVDWKNVLAFQAQLNRVPRQLGEMAVATLQHEWGAKVAGSDAIRFDSLDMVAQAADLRVPTLILHSDDDGFVPADASHALAEARPDLVQMETFTTARHTKLWNYDQLRWENAISAWLDGLQSVDTVAHAEAATETSDDSASDATQHSAEVDDA